MKKMMFLAVFAFAAQFAQAQIQLQDVQEEVAVTIGTFPTMGKKVSALRYIKLGDDDPVYYLSLSSTNQFDDALFFALGSTVEEAVKSAKMIQHMMKTQNLQTTLSITDAQGRPMKINIFKKNLITIKSEEQTLGGTVFLSAVNVQKVIDWLQTKAEAKVNRASGRNTKPLEKIEMDEDEMIYL